MAHIHYEEEQRFSKVTWIWVALVLLFLTVPLMMAGDDSINQDEKVRMILVTALAFLPMVAILFFAKLQVKIDGHGLHYKFLPAIWTWRTLNKNIIESFEVSPKKHLWEKFEMGYGYRRNRITKTISMNVLGTKYARLTLTDGRKFNIGTINPESMERALRQLTSPDND